MAGQYSETMSEIGHEWQEITDLPTNWREFCREDLQAIHRQWTSDRSLIKDERKVQKFQEQLALRWAIETGIIERLYKVDRGVTVQILEAGMEALGQFHARGRISTDARALITDQREALEMVMDLVGGARNLSSSYIKELHQRLTLSQGECDAEDQFGNPIKVQLVKGAWKKQQNNPRRHDGLIHEYCPPEHVQDQIDRLLAMHQSHTDTCPEVEAAWLHHRFTQIHPFQDGNGRVARALTGAVFLKAGHLVLVIRDEDHREMYLDALEAADGGNLRPLVDLFAEIQIHDLNEAIRSLRELRGETVVRVTESLAERARRRMEASQEKAAGIMNELTQIAHIRLEEAEGELKRAFEQQHVVFRTRIFSDEEGKQDWWSWQIIDTAKAHRYYAELARPRRWVALGMSLPEIEREETKLVISLHAVGHAADLHAATAFLTRPLGSGESYDSNRWENEVVSEYPFRFGTETVARTKIEDRFRSWIDKIVEAGLSMWGERL